VSRGASHFALGGLGCGGDGVGELALGGGQVAWTEEGGGNDLELTVMAGRLPRGKTKQLEYEINGDRAGGDPTGGWVGNLVGSGSSLAYNSWDVACDRPPGEECGDGDPKARVTNEKLVRVGKAGTSAIGSGHEAYALAAVAGGRFAVMRADGVATLRSTGEPAAFVPDPGRTVRAVGLSPTALAIERASTLDLYDPLTGSLSKSIGLGSAAPLRLVGVTQSYALLRGSPGMALVRLGDGSAVTLALLPAARSPVDVRLTDAGLFYAYNVARGHHLGRVGFVPARSLAHAF
jgi:hypothetical protein